MMTICQIVSDDGMLKSVHNVRVYGIVVNYIVTYDP